MMTKTRHQEIVIKTRELEELTKSLLQESEEFLVPVNFAIHLYKARVLSMNLRELIDPDDIEA